MSDVRCQVVIRGTDRSPARPCDRPVERDGKCKMHIRVEKNRRPKDREWRDKWDYGQSLQDEAEKIGAALGVDVAAHYSLGSGSYDGRFVVGGDWLRSFAKERGNDEG